MYKQNLKEENGNAVTAYSHRVLLGNWYEAAKAEEIKYKSNLEKTSKGDLMLARFREMNKNINSPVELTQCTGSINFGAKVSLLAPHVPATEPPRDDKKGLILSGRISSSEILTTTDLRDGCKVTCRPVTVPTEGSAFIINSADYCDRKSEQLKYNQEFLLTLASSVDKNKPLFLRYDPNFCFPGLNGMFPLYLSEHPVSSTRWRILPVQKPNITRFEQEGMPVQVNTDIVINHCATNTNLGVNVGVWFLGFYGKFGVPLMKTCLDIYGKELPNNVWQIYIPLKK